MRTYGIFFLVWLCIPFLVVSQNSAENLKKDWYYRFRMQNDFMLIGDCNGCSLPAEIRNCTTCDPQTMQPFQMHWGDVTNDLGWYIGVLATEYKLLNDNGQSTDETIRELYYA